MIICDASLIYDGYDVYDVCARFVCLQNCLAKVRILMLFGAQRLNHRDQGPRVLIRNHRERRGWKRRGWKRRGWNHRGQGLGILIHKRRTHGG
jgi:hypothetical protein